MKKPTMRIKTTNVTILIDKSILAALCFIGLFYLPIRFTPIIVSNALSVKFMPMQVILFTTHPFLTINS